MVESLNLGLGINSIGDDYYPCVKGDIVYFTSNRLGGKGANDIYKGSKISNDQLLVADVPPPAVSLEKLADEVNEHTEIQMQMRWFLIKKKRLSYRNLMQVK